MQHKNESQLINGTERATLRLWPEVGRILGLSRGSVFQAAKLGQIPTIRVGKRLLVPRVALERLLTCERPQTEQSEPLEAA